MQPYETYSSSICICAVDQIQQLMRFCRINVCITGVISPLHCLVHPEGQSGGQLDATNRHTCSQWPSSDCYLLTYVCSNIHDSVSVIDPNAFLQVALLFGNLVVDKQGFCFCTCWDLPAIWQHHKSLCMCCSTLLCGLCCLSIMHSLTASCPQFTHSAVR